MEPAGLTAGQDGTQNMSLTIETENIIPIVINAAAGVPDLDEDDSEESFQASESSRSEESGNRSGSESLVQRFDELNIDCFDKDYGRKHFFRILGQSVLYSSKKGTHHPIIKHGWLFKQAAVVPKWQKRWCVLSRCKEGGVTLAYYRQKEDTSAKGKIELGTTSHTLMIPEKQASREFQFKMLSSDEKPINFSAESYFDMMSWLTAIEASVSETNDIVLKHQFRGLWNDAGIGGFIIRYGVRKRNARGLLQTRVVEFNFAENSIRNTKRGETQTLLPFRTLKQVSFCSPGKKGTGYGLEISFTGHRPWPLFFDTRQARDDMVALVRQILDGTINEQSLRSRWPHFVLKTGQMVRKNVRASPGHVGLHATLKGNLHFVLHEYQLSVYPEDEQLRNRPWYVFSLPGLWLGYKPSQKLLTLGRYTFVCPSSADCESWFRAVQAAATLQSDVITHETKIREDLKQVYLKTVDRVQQLLNANVTPQSNAPPVEQERIELMMKTLWVLQFPDEPWGGNASSKWLDVGFQRGGPASDLRSSGLLGLHCMIYFVMKYPVEFNGILDRQKAVLSGGRRLNYPVAIACINVVALVVKMLGLGDGGLRSDGCSVNAPQAFASFVANDIDQPVQLPTRFVQIRSTQSTGLNPSELLQTYESQLLNCENVIFEEIFCTIFPLLDRFFIEMEAGYMEFGQVMAAVKDHVTKLFDSKPNTICEFRKLAHPNR